jgi:hypothetical protein
MQAQSLLISQPFPDGEKYLGVVIIRYRLVKNFIFGEFLGIKCTVYNKRTVKKNDKTRFNVITRYDSYSIMHNECHIASAATVIISLGCCEM